jgi:polysaccharide deacetylase 2 family uncharacterized protein YibQ
VVALIAALVVGRILLVNDPRGGQPSVEVNVNGAPPSNAVAQTVASGPLPGTITAGPEIPATSPAVTAVGEDVPDGNADAAAPDQSLTELLEATPKGALPRISPSGQTPFNAYAPASLIPATAAGKPLIALVVTGLGLNPSSTSSAITDLPEMVTLAFAPYGKQLGTFAASARASGHELLLEVPLEPFDYPDSDPGPDTLLVGKAPKDNLDKLYNVMGKFPGYVGLINHMGARFTASTNDFTPVMEELGTRGLGYLDDGSSNRSVAGDIAGSNSVPFGKADMALDQDPARGSILAALDALEAKARDKGTAIGVVSALPVSIATIAEWSKAAQGRGVVLVPVSALMQKSQ